MPDLLVVYATRMGATREIAELVAEEARAAGLSATLAAAGSSPDPSGYRGVVVGSGLYVRRWLPSATRYLRRRAGALEQRRVWLFQDGPCGIDDPDADISTAVCETGVPRSVMRVAHRVGAAEPMTFGGRLDRAHATGWVSRWMARSPGLAGDYRDWAQIRRWARGIAEELRITDNLPGNQVPRAGSH